MKGISLAIISFVGLESISQAAEETQRPASIIPRTSIALILDDFDLCALVLEPGARHAYRGIRFRSMRTATRSMLWQWLGNNDNNGKAVALIATEVPYWGAIAAFYVPVLGAILLLISSNSGVFGSSRIAYAMASGGLLPSIFQRVHPKFRTPTVSLVGLYGARAARSALCGVALARPANGRRLRDALQRRKRHRFSRRSLRVRCGDKLLVRLRRTGRAAALTIR